MNQEDLSSKRFDNLLIALEALDSKLDYVLGDVSPYVADMDMDQEIENSLVKSKRDKEGDSMQLEIDIRKEDMNWEDVIDR